MKYDLGGVVIDRCPLSLLKHPWTQEVMKLYSAYKKGITPNARWRDETAHYQACMTAVAGMEGEAEQWYRKESEKRRGSGS